MHTSEECSGILNHSIQLCRSNLDPNGSKTDRELWNALEIAQLKSVVAEFVRGLGKHVNNNYNRFWKMN